MIVFPKSALRAISRLFARNLSNWNGFSTIRQFRIISSTLRIYSSLHSYYKLSVYFQIILVINISFTWKQDPRISHCQSSRHCGGKWKGKGPPPLPSFPNTTIRPKCSRSTNLIPFVYLGEINAQTRWKELHMTTLERKAFPLALGVCFREKTNCNFYNKHFTGVRCAPPCCWLTLAAVLRNRPAAFGFGYSLKWIHVLCYYLATASGAQDVTWYYVYVYRQTSRVT